MLNRRDIYRANGLDGFRRFICRRPASDFFQARFFTYTRIRADCVTSDLFHDVSAIRPDFRDNGRLKRAPRGCDR